MPGPDQLGERQPEGPVLAGLQPGVLAVGDQDAAVAVPLELVPGAASQHKGSGSCSAARASVTGHRPGQIRR